MIVYLDENLPASIAKALHELQTHFNGEHFQVLHLNDRYPQGTKDEEWIPAVGAEGGLVITQDCNIHRMRSQRDLIAEHGVGLVFLKPPSKNGFSYWQQVELIVELWPAIKNIAGSKKLPYSYRASARNRKLEPLE